MSSPNLNLKKSLPQPQQQMKPIAPDPKFPYQNQRASLEDLQSFPISPEDWFGGGGRIMFSDPVKKTLAPKAGALALYKQAIRGRAVAPEAPEGPEGDARRAAYNQAENTPGTANYYSNPANYNIPETGYRVAPGPDWYQRQMQTKEQKLRDNDPYRKQQQSQDEARQTAEIVAMSNMMTAANRQARENNQPLPYDGSQYAKTYPGGKLPPTAIPDYKPKPPAPAPAPTPAATQNNSTEPQGLNYKPNSPIQPQSPQGNPFGSPQRLDLSVPQNTTPAPQQGNPVNIPLAPPTTNRPQPTRGFPIRLTNTKPPVINLSKQQPGAVMGSNTSMPKKLNLNTTPLSPSGVGKVAQEHSTAAWKGFLSALQKEGANEDFIMGMMKEANEQEGFLNNFRSMLHGSTDLDETGLPENRHHIIPGVSNKLLGGIGGASLGHMLGGEVGAQGPWAMALPALGALAGYHYLPHLMNKWKDSYGTGVNSINPVAAAINSRNMVNIAG